MNKEEARSLLEEWLSQEKMVTLPIVDIVIHTINETEEKVLNDWTFKGLIKIAYDLKDKQC